MVATLGTERRALGLPGLRLVRRLVLLRHPGDVCLLEAGLGTAADDRQTGWTNAPLEHVEPGRLDAEPKPNRSASTLSGAEAEESFESGSPGCRIETARGSGY